MKIGAYFIFLLTTLALMSCNDITRNEHKSTFVENNGVTRNERKGTFVEKYRESFVNSDLIHFNYNPRSKFEFWSSSASYRIYLHSKSKININNEGDKALLDTTNKLQKAISNFLSFAEIHSDSLSFKNLHVYDWISRDSIGNYVLMNDSNDCYLIPDSIFEFDPIVYFSELESLINEMEILSIVSWKDEVQVIFGTNVGLVYFPNRATVEDTLNRDLRMIDDYWFENKGEVSIGY